MEISNQKKTFKDKDLQQLVGQLLRYGVFTVSAIVLLGGLYYMFLHAQQPIPDYHTFAGGKEKMLLHFDQFDAAALIEIGILSLIATPILRVVFSLVAFVLEKDKLYVFITLIVLCILIFNIIYG